MVLASNLLEQTYIEDYVFQKRSTITIRSKKCGEHFTYTIARDKYDDRAFRVYLLTGENNNDDYRYIGIFYRSSRTYVLPGLYKANEYAQKVPLSIQVIRYVLTNINHLPDTIEVYHSCKCALCGRKLTTPNSLRTGFGPKCRKYLYGDNNNEQIRIDF